MIGAIEGRIYEEFVVARIYEKFYIKRKKISEMTIRFEFNFSKDDCMAVVHELV